MNRFQPIAKAAIQLSQTMTPGLRVVAILLAVTIVVSLTLLFQTSDIASTELLFDGQSFTQGELQRIHVALAKADLSDYKVIGRVVRIPSKLRSEYINAVSEAGVMPPTHSHATDAINKPSIFELPAQNRARIQNAIQQDLADDIRELPGVEEASVRVHVKESNGLPRRVTVSASVSVRCENDTTLPPDTANTIRQLVAGIHEQLSPVDVGVIDLTTGKAYPAGSPVEIRASATNAAFAENEKIERHLQAKVEHSLRGYPGARVVVNTRLQNRDAENQEQLCVVVEIPTSYYYREWQARHEALIGTPGGMPNAKDLATLRESTESEIERITRQLCGDVVVAVKTFNDSLGNAESPRTIVVAQEWLSKQWPIVLAIGAVLLFAWNIRVGLKPPPTVTEMPSADSPPESSRTMFETSETDPQRELQHSVSPSIKLQAGDLREKLSSVVRSDPDAAARVLQDWMKEAS